MALAGAAVMTKTTRSQVLVLGWAEIDKTPFSERQLQVERIDVSQLDQARLSRACAVLVADFPGKFGVLNAYLGGPFALAASLGVRTAIQVRDADIGRAASLREATFKRFGAKGELALSWVMIGFDEVGVAETIARYDPGPPLGQASVVLVGGAALEPATRTLLQRSFEDCSEIVIEPLRGGKTAKQTFRVYAKLREASLQPMPFFFKQGTPEDIRDERLRYRNIAEPFIPFHLRPALNEARSVTTLTDAVLVSNFVEGGMPMRDAMRHGHGRNAIFSLFEVTLRGIRSHAAQSAKSAELLRSFIKERVRAKEIAQNHPARIRVARKFGLKTDPVTLEGHLAAAANNEDIRRGYYHGDMHAGNVLVRHGDSIVIDFGSMTFGPLTADPAILEISLAFGTDEADRPDAFGEWRSLVDELFRGQAFLMPPVVTSEHGHFSWLRKAVRELRHVVNSCGSTPKERALVLAACLLRFARLSPDDLPSRQMRRLSEARRSYALAIAEDLYSNLS